MSSFRITNVQNVVFHSPVGTPIDISTNANGDIVVTVGRDASLPVETADACVIEIPELSRIEDSSGTLSQEYDSEEFKNLENTPLVPPPHSLDPEDAHGIVVDNAFVRSHSLSFDADADADSYSRYQSLSFVEEEDDDVLQETIIDAMRYLS